MSKEEVSRYAETLIKTSIENTIETSFPYPHKQNVVAQWTTKIIDNILSKLKEKSNSYRFIVNCDIVQKGTAFHTSSSCLWEPSVDFNSSYRWESPHLFCIVKIFGFFTD